MRGAIPPPVCLHNVDADNFAFLLLPVIVEEMCGPGSSVGIVTDYGLDGPDRIPVGTRFSARPDRPWGSPSLL